MNKLAVAGLVLAATVAFAPAAFAQTVTQAPTPGCGAALLALAQAEKAADDATAADKAAADAKKADDAATAAETALKTAIDAQFVYSQDPFNDNPAAGAAEARVLVLKEHLDDGPESPWKNVADRIAKLNAVIAARADLAVKVAAAADTNAEALRIEADKTDAAALADAAKKAEVAADKACGHTAGEDVRFENCDEVRTAGKAPLPSTDPDYRVGLDADRDGLACEAAENTVTPTPSPSVPVPSQIDTGRP